MIIPQEQQGRPMVYKSIVDTIGNTPLVELKSLSPKPGVTILGKLEGTNPSGSVKDRIARFMVEKAEKDRCLSPYMTILEATSGNTGIGLAMIGRAKGYSVFIVLPENASPERVQILRAYGAKIHFSPAREGTNGAVAIAEKMAANDRSFYMPYQFGNEANPRAHFETTGPEIVRDLPGIDVFVAGLGTGGTLTGVGRCLKAYNQSIRIVAASPILNDPIEGLRSLDAGFIPPVLDKSVIDEILYIPSEEARSHTRLLMDGEGIFAGISSGAAIAAARRVAMRMDSGRIVCLLPDGGWKYLSTGVWTKDRGTGDDLIVLAR